MTLINPTAAPSAYRAHWVEALWELREQGVQIRNEGFSTTALDSWMEKFNRWHAEVLEQAARLSVDLRNYLDPIDQITLKNHVPPQNLALNNADLALRISIMSEMLERLANHLNRAAEP